jgi:light-regulated signal transduction histidine kinase (bacteriophytochrome)
VTDTDPAFVPDRELHTPAYETPDLTTCDREPIHIPGAIQPHGVLLALDERMRVAAASTNTDRHLGVPADALVGRPLDEAVGATTAEAVLALVDRAEPGEPARVVLDTGRGDLDQRLADVLTHQSGEHLVVEIEPVSTSGTQHVSYRSTRSAVTRLTAAASVEDLTQRLAAEIRSLTGFDRVMVYRFDEQWNGEVVAEEKLDRLNSFKGLHYPASDIPAQARRLYTSNWTRLIADIGYRPVPLHPVRDPGTGRPLDLSHSVLRSVSPIHIEYLTNMGVTASMSVSIVIDGVLWGLIACHHYSGPHQPSLDARSAAEFLGQTASTLIADRERSDQRAAALAARSVLSEIISTVTSDPRTPHQALMAHPSLLSLFEASGAALHADGETLRVGQLPPESVVTRIAEAMAAEGGQDGVVASQNLAALDPTLAAHSELAAGAFRIGNGPGRWLLLVRPERRQVVDWGGDPTNKAIAAAEGPDVRLSPRKSFEKWQQVVSGRSHPWESWHSQTASELRAHIANVLVQRTQEQVSVAESLQRSVVPYEVPRFDGVELSALYLSAPGSQIGGDWWDALELPDGRVAVVAGDVAGHGVKAAAAMVQARTALRAYLLEGHALGHCLDRLDNLFVRLLDGHTATVVVVAVDPGSGRTEVASAGHPPALLVSGGRTSALDLGRRPLLGVGVVGGRSASVTLEPGDTVLLYSDGVVENRDASIDASIDQLATLAGTGPDADLEAWVRRLVRETDPTQGDDRTAVAVRRTPF